MIKVTTEYFYGFKYPNKFDGNILTGPDPKKAQTFSPKDEAVGILCSTVNQLLPEDQNKFKLYKDLVGNWYMKRKIPHLITK